MILGSTSRLWYDGSLSLPTAPLGRATSLHTSRGSFAPYPCSPCFSPVTLLWCLNERPPRRPVSSALERWRQLSHAAIPPPSRRWLPSLSQSEMGKHQIALPRHQSQYQVVGRFVPNEKYDEANPQCKVYRMNLFAKNKVVARSRFWYFMSRMCRVKRANGQIIAVNEISEKSPERVKNFGIWFRYDSRTGTHNAYKEYRELSLTAAVNAMCTPNALSHPSLVEGRRLIARYPSFDGTQCCAPGSAHRCAPPPPPPPPPSCRPGHGWSVPLQVCRHPDPPDEGAEARGVQAPQH